MADGNIDLAVIRTDGGQFIFVKADLFLFNRG
jgi:hypothetical protein